MVYMKNPRGFFVGMRQKAVERRAEAAQGSASAAGAGKSPANSLQASTAQRGRGADVPRFGSMFTDEELGARLGVPPRGRIRVSHENRCIAIVDRIVDDEDGSYADIGIGDTIRYEGQDMPGRGEESDQALDGANLDLAVSKARGYTVLYFTREGSALVFGKVLECNSISFEKNGKHSVIVFRMRVVGDKPIVYERLNPEIERALQSIEEGTLEGEEYTADEYIEYIKKVLG